MPRCLSRAERDAIYSEFQKLSTAGNSMLQAAQILSNQYGISTERMRSLLQRRNSHPAFVHGNDIFSAKQEKTLVAAVEARSALNTPLSRQAFINVARQLRGKSEGWDADGWFTNFLKRLKTRLSLRTVKGLSAKRLATSTLSSVEEWVEFLPDFMEKNGLSSKWIVNADETRISMNEMHNGRFLGPKQQHTLGVRETERGKFATYLPFIAANGVVVMDVFIVPVSSNGASNFSLEQVDRRAQNDHPVFWAFTSSGYLNNELWLVILQKFKEVMDGLAPGIEPVLLLDNLATHRTDAALEFCSSNSIHVIMLPPHVSHFLQSLDNVPFANFKLQLYKTAQIRLMSVTETKRELGSVLLSVAQQIKGCLTKAVIRAAFENVGICPWNKDAILKKAVANCGEVGSFTEPTDEVTAMAQILVKSLSTAEKRVMGVPVKVAGVGSRLFSGEEILDQHKKQKKEEEQRRQQREEEKAAQVAQREEKEKARVARVAQWVCRGSHRSDEERPVWKDSPLWEWCSFCEEFGLCPRCKKKCSGLMKEHEEQCAAKSAIAMKKSKK